MRNKLEINNYIINNNINMDKIVDDYTPYIKTIIRNMVGTNLSEEDKEEILLDTYFVLWKKYNENYEIFELSSFIAGITRNLIKEKLKKLNYNMIEIEKCENLLKYNDLDIEAQERFTVKEVYNKISNLKDIDIKIIHMFYYYNKTIKDIANELEISEVNVKTRLHRIRKKIKHELKKGGF